MTNYVSLHNHTTSSIMDSLIEPSQLFLKVKELGQTAVAVTDHISLAAAWDSLKYSKEAGVKLIIGCEFYFVNNVADEDERLRHIILIAKNAIGYRNLLTISKEGYDNATQTKKKVYARIDWKIIEKYKEGLICTTACSSGIIGQLINSRRLDEAKAQAKRLKDIFGDNLALELQPHAMKRTANSYIDYIDQTYTNHKLKQIGEEFDIKCIAATNAHYINKEDHDAHDVLLAIGASQPRFSGNRIAYSVPEFYLKSGEEVEAFFTRHFGAEFAKSLCYNTIYFADQCEEPDWIDPKHSNPSGKELPRFPVKDQPDYKLFKEWCKENNIGLLVDGKEITKYKSRIQLEDDVAYLRYACEKGLKEKGITEDGVKLIKYRERVKEELEVLEYRGFSSYMLMAADILEYARTQNVRLGPGRGCLTGDALVLTANGFKELSAICKNDTVYTHTGKKQKILESYKYDIDEDLLSIKTELSYNDIVLTKDHKLYAVKAQETDSYKKAKLRDAKYLDKIKRWEDLDSPTWISAKDLVSDDYIFMPYPERTIKAMPNYVDLAKFATDIKVENEFLIQEIGIENEFSIRAVSKNNGVSRNFVKKLKNNKNSLIDVMGRRATRSIRAYNKIKSYLEDNNTNIDEWIKNKNTRVKKIKRNIKFDESFLYFIGRWVGDGWYRKGSEYSIGIAFNSNDQCGIDRIKNYIESIGFEVSLYKAKDKDLTQLVVYSKLIVEMFKYYFPDYKLTSDTKHLPSFFRHLSDNFLKALLMGYMDSDGHVEEDFSRQLRRENIDTTSLRLALELKESLLYIKIPSSISTRKPFYRGKYKCKQSYKIRFKGLCCEKSINNRFKKNGYFCKILNIQTSSNNYVYDIKVENDCSYITSNYAVHNSGGGALIGYLLDIHVVDSIKYGLVFARFHNKEKLAYPDLDLDLASSEEIEAYVRKKYGEDCVARISNVLTLKPRVYVKDIARTFMFGGSRTEAAKIGQAIADTVPDLCNTYEEAITASPLFAEYTKRYPELARYSKHIAGKARDMGTHAAGVIISKRPLTGLVPLRRDKHNNILIEYEKERTEENGLVKMDFLIIETLKIMDNTYKLIKMLGKTPPPDPIDYEQYDKKTYDLIASGNTLCVFQLGKSSGTIGLCKQIKPQNIEEMAMINTLTRPAAQDIRQDFIDTKNGNKAMHIRYKCLERALKDTFGFPIYDECLMLVAKDVAAWSLDEADRLRKMTKWKGKYPEKIEAWKQDFIKRSIGNGIKENTAKEVWAMIEKLGSYAFNKSHAVFYSVLGFQTAYLKAHYPLEFLTANLMSQVHSNAPVAKANIIKIKSEIRALNIKIIPPDINESDIVYKIIDDKTLMSSLDSLKYMTDRGIPEIMAKRPFKDMEDFLTKVDGRVVNAKCVQALAAAGALDSFGMSRKLMCLHAGDYKKKLKVWLKKDPKKRGDSFEYPWPEMAEWNITERYALEEEYLGEGFSGTFYDRYPNFFDVKGDQAVTDLSDLATMFPKPSKKTDSNKKWVPGLKGVVQDFFKFKIKKEDSKLLGRTMAKMTLADIHNNTVSVTIFPDSLDDLESKVKNLYKKEFTLGAAINICGYINWYNDEVSFILENLKEYRSSPAMPKDTESRKVKLPRAVKKKVKVTEIDPDAYLEEVEDDMVNDGVVDVDDDDSMDAFV